MPVRLTVLGIDCRAETRVTRERPQVQPFEPDADQPQRGIHERAAQRERRDAEPVRRHWHAEVTCVEGCGEVRTRGAHVGAGCAAYFWNAGGTTARSGASRIAMRIWNSSTSAGTGF